MALKAHHLRPAPGAKSAAKRVGRLEPSKGKVSWKSVPETPIALAAGPDGVVWVVLGSGDRIAKLPAKG